MPDDTTNTDAAETETDSKEEPVDPAKGDDWEAKYKEMQKHSREWEKRAKDAAPAIKKLAELEEAQKTELEKAQARADAAEKSAAEAAVSALRAQVALDKKLTPSQAKRLVGSTQEELEADADELLADLKNNAPGTAPSSDGQGKQGDVVGQTKQITSRDELQSMSREEKLAAYRDGRLKTLTG
jgi:hypothetical protein